MLTHGSAQANPTNHPERGWFFFDDPLNEEPQKPVPNPVPRVASPPPTELPPAPKEDKCKKKETWTPGCGFVNPGNDFAFQAKQRDELLERMSMAENDPKAVENFQYYMRWVLERTSQVTNLWWYNMVQNPELDPTVGAPVTTMGLRLMTDVKKGHQDEIFNLIREEGGMFVYFSRHDCDFCQQMAEPLRQMEKKTGIPLRNAALDDRCMPGFEEGCMTAPATLPPAQALQVTIVPTVFLYVKPNTWLRIGTGVVDTASMMSRTVQFFSAYRNALLKGVENGMSGRASVDFGGLEPSGVAKGLPAPEKDGQIRMPSEEDVERMLKGGI